MLGNLRRPEAGIWASLVIFGALLLLPNRGGPEPQSLFNYYAPLAVASLPELFVGLLSLSVVGIYLRGLEVLLGTHPREMSPTMQLPHWGWRAFIRPSLKNLAASVPSVLAATVALLVLLLALPGLNAWNATRLQDHLLLGWDRALTGTYPFLALATVRYPGWFVQAVIFSFQYLGSALVILAAYLLASHLEIFRESLSAFFIALVIMLPGWLLFPALSPHDRFIDNVYQLPMPPAVKDRIARYQPQKEIRKFLEEARGVKREKLGVLPTTTLPSAHVALAALLVYYAWRSRPWLAIAAAPLAVFSILGTVLLAQHYLVDIPAGIAAAVLAIGVAYYLTRGNRTTLPKPSS